MFVIERDASVILRGNFYSCLLNLCTGFLIESRDKKGIRRNRNSFLTLGIALLSYLLSFIALLSYHISIPYHSCSLSSPGTLVPKKYSVMLILKWGYCCKIANCIKKPKLRLPVRNWIPWLQASAFTIMKPNQSRP